MGVFIVEGSKGDKYAVTLFPKSTCQCPSTGICYHIIAARLSIGQFYLEDTKPINLTRLRRNSRKRADKKGGRKKPRVNDYETELLVNVAPDSILQTTLENSLLDNLDNTPSKLITSTPRHNDNHIIQTPTPSKVIPRRIIRRRNIETPSKKMKKVTFADKINSIHLMSSPDGNNECQNLRDDLQCPFTTETDEVEYQEPIQNNS